MWPTAAMALRVEKDEKTVKDCRAAERHWQSVATVSEEARGVATAAAEECRAQLTAAEERERTLQAQVVREMMICRPAQLATQLGELLGRWGEPGGVRRVGWAATQEGLRAQLMTSVAKGTAAAVATATWEQKHAAAQEVAEVSDACVIDGVACARSPSARGCCRLTRYACIQVRAAALSEQLESTRRRLAEAVQAQAIQNAELVKERRFRRIAEQSQLRAALSGRGAAMSDTDVHGGELDGDLLLGGDAVLKLPPRPALNSRSSGAAAAAATEGEEQEQSDSPPALPKRSRSAQ
jgi:hypothetical protein